MTEEPANDNDEPEVEEHILGLDGDD